MNKINNLNDTLNGGFRGLFGEVVGADCYRLKQLNFTPGIFFDLGGNVGVTTRFARSLFPDALIVTVEPDKENYSLLVRFTEIDDKMILLNMAIGEGEMWRRKEIPNGAHQSYVTHNLINDAQGGIEKAMVHTIMLDELINQHLKEGMKSVLKMDIEGGEISIWNHPPSIAAMKKIDYIAAETHWWEKEKETEILKSFSDTHDIEINQYSFFAIKK